MCFFTHIGGHAARCGDDGPGWDVLEAMKPRMKLYKFERNMSFFKMGGKKTTQVECVYILHVYRYQRT